MDIPKNFKKFKTSVSYPTIIQVLFFTLVFLWWSYEAVEKYLNEPITTSVIFTLGKSSLKMVSKLF